MGGGGGEEVEERNAGLVGFTSGWLDSLITREATLDLFPIGRQGSEIIGATLATLPNSDFP